MFKTLETSNHGIIPILALRSETYLTFRPPSCQFLFKLLALVCSHGYRSLSIISMAIPRLAFGLDIVMLQVDISASTNNWWLCHNEGRTRYIHHCLSHFVVVGCSLQVILCWDICLRSILTQCGPVTPHGDIDLGQHRLRWWLVAWWQQAIT